MHTYDSDPTLDFSHDLIFYRLVHLLSVYVDVHRGLLPQGVLGDAGQEVTDHQLVHAGLVA